MSISVLVSSFQKRLRLANDMPNVSPDHSDSVATGTITLLAIFFSWGMRSYYGGMDAYHAAICRLFIWFIAFTMRLRALWFWENRGLRSIIAIVCLLIVALTLEWIFEYTDGYVREDACTEEVKIWVLDRYREYSMSTMSSWLLLSFAFIFVLPSPMVYMFLRAPLRWTIEGYRCVQHWARGKAYHTATHPISPLPLEIDCLINLALIAALVVSTEKTVDINSHLFEDDSELDWSFGQTLAVFMVLASALQPFREMRKTWKLWEFHRRKRQLTRQFEGEDCDGSSTLRLDREKGSSPRMSRHRFMEDDEEDQRARDGAWNRQLLLVTGPIQEDQIHRPPNLHIQTISSTIYPIRRPNVPADRLGFQLGILHAPHPPPFVESALTTSSSYAVLNETPLLHPTASAELLVVNDGPRFSSQPPRPSPTWHVHRFGGHIPLCNTTIIQSTHPIWSHLQPGDRIGLFRTVEGRNVWTKTHEAHIMFQAPVTLHPQVSETTVRPSSGTRDVRSRA